MLKDFTLRWPMARFDRSAPRSIRRIWPLPSPSPAENRRSTWIEDRDAIPDSHDGPSLARGRVDPAGVGRDPGELPQLLPARLRFALPPGPRGDVHRRLPGGVLRAYLFRPGRAAQRLDPAQRRRSPSSPRIAPPVGLGSNDCVAVARAPKRCGDVAALLRRLAGGAELSLAVGGDGSLCDHRRRSRVWPSLRPAPPLDVPLLCPDLFGSGPSSDLGGGGADRGAESRRGVHLRGVV